MSSPGGESHPTWASARPLVLPCPRHPHPPTRHCLVGNVTSHTYHTHHHMFSSADAQAQNLRPLTCELSLQRGSRGLDGAPVHPSAWLRPAQWSLSGPPKGASSGMARCAAVHLLIGRTARGLASSTHKGAPPHRPSQPRVELCSSHPQTPRPALRPA